MLRGSPEEVEMLEHVRAAVGLDSVVVVGVGLRRLFALCEAAHSMISVDTGPAHAAAALGLPLVVMYGAEAQRYWLPRSISGSPVVGVGGPPESVRADEIPVEAVFDAWRWSSREWKRRLGVNSPEFLWRSALSRPAGATGCVSILAPVTIGGATIPGGCALMNGPFCPWGTGLRRLLRHRS